MRAFLAVELSKEMIGKLSAVAHQLDKSGADVAWVRAQNLHLTVMFLGEITAEQVDTVRSAVAAVATQHPACTIRLDHLGAFPSASRPRVIWAGAALPEADPLVRLAENIRLAVRSLGIPDEERSFVPHVTIGRIRSQKRMSQLCGLFSAEAESWRPTAPCKIESVALFESRLSPEGPAYRLIGSCALQPAR